MIGLCLLLVWRPGALAGAQNTGFLHASGVTNLDNNNQPITLRGVNLGSWLWPEYYMMGSPNLSAYNSAGTGTGGINNYYDGLVAAIQDVLGGDTNLTAQVLDAYWSNFITPADMVFLHANGFNSVRVPFTFEEFFYVTNWANNYPTNGYDINTGFKYLDNLVAYCSTNAIYVIPDMHCAPGGPNNLSVTNYGGTLNTNTASVFVSGPNLALAGHIWSRIAAHYATNTWLGGYDLLNEPVNTSAANGQVGSPTLSITYSNLVRTIRQVDTNHLLLCEGDFYASTLYDVDNTGWSDPNANLSFSDHDYGSGLPLGTGNRATCVGANVPDWAGEFGINSTHWYNKLVFGTYERPVTLTQNSRTATISEGHCFWAYKISSQCYGLVQNPQTPGWNALKAYWASPGTVPRPSVSEAYNWLMAYAQGTLFSNCLVHPEVADSLNRPAGSFTNLALPYKAGVTIPGKIFAADYDMGEVGIAYADTVFDDEANHGPGGTAWNNGFFGRDDGVDMTRCADPGTLLKVGWNDAGEWQRHTLTCAPGSYNLFIRYAGGATGGVVRASLLILNNTNHALVLSSNDLTGPVTLPTTGGYAAYATYAVNGITVTNSGLASLQIDCVNPGYDLAWVEFVPANGAPFPPLGESVVGAQSGPPPGLTAGLAATPGNGAVSLNWVPCETAASYNIKRATISGGPYLTVASSSTPSYLDLGLSNGVSYYYVVTAFNTNGESTNSTEIGSTPVHGSLPLGWIDQDVGVATLWDGSVGDVGWPGTAAFAGGVYTVSGSGIDIWNNADSFHYVYRAVSGDCTNIARVSGLQNTDPWAKAGVMLRESLNQDAINAFVAVTSQNGALFSYRPATYGASASSGQAGPAAPYYVKLVRIGNTFTAYTSTSGSVWSQVGSPVTLAMSRDAFVGMAVTAHNNTRLNTATFDNVSVAGQLPSAPSHLNAAAAYTQIALSWWPVAGATGYNVQRSTTNGGPYTTVAAGLTATNYTDLAISNGVSYYYVVAAVNWNGPSPWSNQAGTSAPLPNLSVAYSGNALALSWPATASGFSLYGATNLAAPVLWTLVTNAAASQSSTWNLTLPTGGGSSFFRLGSP
ncbi:MAG TPA: cellulase family glycosylhydrolase [Candidatus Binatia bacterium]|nr:cellulase family glycosylhydrolase [Candidatus Binatia bacterium]